MCVEIALKLSYNAIASTAYTIAQKGMVMKMKRKHLCAASLLLALNMTTVQAASISDIGYDVDNDIVTINGSGTPMKKVTLEILNNGVTAEALKNAKASEISDYIYRIDQTKTDDNGGFTFSFKMAGSNDEYIVRANVDGIAEGVLVLVGAEDYEKALSAFNGAGTVKEMVEAINEYGAAIGLANSYYGYLDEDQTENVAKAILDKREALEKKVFTKAKQISEPYNEQTLIEAFIKSKSDSRIDPKKLAEENESILKLGELKIYDVYNALTDAQRAEVMKNTSSSGDISAIEDIRTAFTEKAALAGVKYVGGYAKLYTILEKHNDVYGIDFTEYNELSDFNKTRVMQAIEGKSYSSLKELRDAFSSEVTVVKKKVTQGSSSGGGGGAATISPSAAQEGVGQTAAKKPFNDIENYAWAEESILALYKKNIISGRGDGVFAPGDYVKREEFVKMLICAINAGVGANTDRFVDVDADAWYAGYVNKAIELELVSGMAEDYFGTGMNITRQDIAVILARCAKLKGITLPEKKSTAFADEDKISEYAREAVKMLAASGIINGNENGEFAPERFATRAETARLIFEFLKYLQ